jgi:hypothetical protein
MLFRIWRPNLLRISRGGSCDCTGRHRLQTMLDGGN